MRKIVLLCSVGVSTSILMQKMQEEADRQGYACTIRAYPISQAAEAVSTAGVILMAPQSGHAIAELQVKYPNVPSTVIPQKLYASMDAVEILDLAQNVSGDY